MQAKKIKFNSLIPELSVTSIEKSLNFYQNIGFKIVYERKENKFYFLELEKNQIMIEEINENWKVADLEYPFGRGINISMTMKDIEKYYQKILDLKIPVFRPLTTNEYRVETKIYQDKEFLIQDPDGYLLRFNN